MEIIEYYIIFALTTGITSCYEFLAPAIRKAKEQGIINTFTESTWLSYIIYAVITSFFAPLSFWPIFIPNLNQRFRNGIEKAVMENQI